MSAASTSPLPLPLDSLWVVSPAYNESSRLERTLQSLLRVVRNVVVVDDGSTDTTGECALEQGAWLVTHAVNCGQGAALQTGIDFALAQGAQIIVTFDSDGQHVAEEIPALIQPLLDGSVDVVLGSRFLGKAENIPWTRRQLLRCATLFTRVVSGLRLTDTHNGFRALSRHAAETIRIRENRMAHASEILHKIQSHGLSYCERPVTIRYSAELAAKGQSGWDALEIAARFLAGNLIR
ncbi:glycosyltransferase family 2 protein [Lignipirellula cremea]|uniref:Undecaprenyl-phosphate mannosyltransferase n=1 Tax=Lignipirellula cremea TaxID=2528010 RepID=A0A518DMA0_9BACT|nr:glycosyltransferase family 2 protein [Lignipirellula cremea]QDU92965.1 Undecaprenyl-phosphate mannosyltransferase [Lignipirellula cremea]